MLPFDGAHVTFGLVSDTVKIIAYSAMAIAYLLMILREYRSRRG